MTEIERYIEFAIENGFDIPLNFTLQPYSNDNDGVYEHTFNGEYVSYKEQKGHTFVSIEKLFTSKEFIEAIARGFGMTGKAYNRQPGDICKTQAMAIYNNSLEEFITNLLDNE